MSTALEASLVIPLILLLAIAMLLCAPSFYERVALAANESIQTSRAEGEATPSESILAVMICTDSLSLLSGWIPGIGTP